MSRQPARTRGLVRDDRRTLRPAKRAKPTTMFGREVLVDLEEAAVVHDRVDEPLHVVGLGRLRGDEGVEGGVLAVDGVVGRATGGPPRGCSRAGRTAARGSSARQARSSSTAKWATPERALWVIAPPSSSLRHLLVGHRPDDVGAGHEHVRRVLHHHVEVGDGGAVDGAARAGPEDRGDLRHDAGGERVAQEDVGVAGEGGDALLDARAARVVEADDGRAHLHREVHDLADLLGVRLGEAAAEDREVLGEDAHEPAVDAAEAGDDAVAGDLLVGHAEVEAAVLDELVELLEGALVEQRARRARAP